MLPGVPPVIRPPAHPARPMRLFRSLAAVALLPGLLAAQSSPRKTATKSAATASPSDILPFKATETTLPNGLKVIVVPTGFPNIVSVQIPVQTGSRNEIEPGKSGFAHFFEHMMFRGTKKYTPDQNNAVMARAGARTNASTSDDRTWYYATFAKEDLENILELYADQFQNLDYAEPEFKTEARAVLGEYNKNSASPGFKLYELTRKTAFTKHTYGHTTMGFIEDIEDMPNQYEYSKQFFSRYYRPENTAIIVAGDVTPEQVLPLVRKYWGNWKRGSFTAQIPKEPAPTGAKYVHQDWSTPTSPQVWVSFRNPAFNETNKDNPALDLVADLWFGPTSDIYRKLVVEERKVDQLDANNTSNKDPELFTVVARIKDPADATYIRDEILRTVNRARTELLPAAKVVNAKSNLRYSLVRSLDNTDAIARIIAAFVHHRRSYATLNNTYRLYTSLTPADLRGASQRYFTDNNLIVSTLSNGALPEAVATLPKIGSLTSPSPLLTPVSNTNAANVGSRNPAADPAAAVRRKVDSLVKLDMNMGPPTLAQVDLTTQTSELPQIQARFVFDAGSAYDPAGKEGLAALTARMIADAGSSKLTITEIRQFLFPIAGSFNAGVDKEVTTFVGSIHKDNWHEFLHVTLDQLVSPGFREEDFKRLKDQQATALKVDLRSNNEEELGKEKLQINTFAGTPYAHPVLGTEAGIAAITLDDIRQFARERYTLANLKVGLNGDVPNGYEQVMRAVLNALPAGTAPGPRPTITGVRPNGLKVEIIRKDTRATAISFGLPIAVTRSHPDFAALSIARAWLGEHRMSSGQLYQRIREVRGMNYGNYAYIEAFPRGMFQFFPDANIPRRAQLFEVWIRPVVPENAHMALRIATAELDNLIANGLTEQQFADTRDYLMNNVYVMTATQGQQLGYALDSKWYGIPEFTSYMRDQLTKLTRDDVNAAIKRHLSATDLNVVIITKDAEGLRDALVSDAFSPIKYDAEKPTALLEEDKVIGARKLNIRAENVRITPVEEVFRQ